MLHSRKSFRLFDVQLVSEFNSASSRITNYLVISAYLPIVSKIIMESLIEDFCLSLHEVGCVKFGNFTLKSGRTSSYYIDLRLLISHPNLMVSVCFSDVVNVLNSLYLTSGHYTDRT